MEELEVPTEHLHEKIQEEAEEKKDKWTLYVALSTAMMAVLAAVAGLLAGHHANEALVERVKASDAWNYYQAKSVKQEILVNTDKIMRAVRGGTGANEHAVGASRNGAAGAGDNGAAVPAEGDNSKDIARYDKEKADVKKQAEEAEKASDAHLAKHVPLASAVTAFQIAIAVSAISLITRRRNLWYGSLLLTVVGAYFLVEGLF
ncbi:DUF4337 domain-containing protein [Puia dinghuensis]|uniref:DUF4337 domain-containing protein n=1 Tax=Puia dinghuensis TaxID=1792502 RepID=A0A8J2UEW2_9BACT|nr:DUF4337 domain-containing protein [Puia dinghuensis]GGB08251.1 hypothetical protein GCM10011511_34770 [Puia dinghuensis]